MDQNRFAKYTPVSIANESIMIKLKALNQVLINANKPLSIIANFKNIMVPDFLEPLKCFLAKIIMAL